MTILTIRANKRFAVCRKVRLLRGSKPVAAGLLVELSLEGCRISRCGETAFEVDEVLTVVPEGAAPFEGRVRWLREGCVGLRLVHPFHIGEFETMLRACRGEMDPPVRAFGT